MGDVWDRVGRLIVGRRRRWRSGCLANNLLDIMEPLLLIDSEMDKQKDGDSAEHPSPSDTTVEVGYLRHGENRGARSKAVSDKRAASVCKEGHIHSGSPGILSN